MREVVSISPRALWWYAQQVEARALLVIARCLRDDMPATLHVDIGDRDLARAVAARIQGLLIEVGPFSMKARTS